MKLSSEIQDNILIVDIKGDLLGENSGAEIIGHITQKVTSEVNACVVNLSAVRYINSSGLGVLITLMTKITNKGSKLILMNPSEQVRKLLEITKLISVFIVKDTIEAAKEEVKN